LTVPSYSYNPSNELTANSTGSYTYDNNGNTLTDASGKSYTWDYENRLIQAIVPGTGTTTFKYDPFGRRIQKSGPLGTTNYLYDGANLLEEVDNSGNITARYSQSGLIDEPLSELRAGTTSYYEADGLGSITSLSSSAGAVANTYRYDSLGNVTNFTGTLSNLFQYTAREFDQETGANFYRARYYDQTIGRFLSEDPSGFRAGQNFYSYTKNNPVNAIDPTGLRTQLCCRPVNDWRAKMVGADHCFIAISGNPNIGGGATTIVSLLHNPPTLNGTADVNAYSNGSSSCVDVPSCSGCSEKTIVNNASNPGPSGPSSYFALGPNSNTYARFQLLAGGCTPPSQAPAFWAPGYNDPIAVPRPPLGRK
jgi:RHS repeat-associated protein